MAHARSLTVPWCQTQWKTQWEGLKIINVLWFLPLVYVITVILGVLVFLFFSFFFFLILGDTFFVFFVNIIFMFFMIFVLLSLEIHGCLFSGLFNNAPTQ